MSFLTIFLHPADLTLTEFLGIILMLVLFAVFVLDPVVLLIYGILKWLVNRTKT